MRILAVLILIAYCEIYDHFLCSFIYAASEKIREYVITLMFKVKI